MTRKFDPKKVGIAGIELAKYLHRKIVTPGTPPGSFEGVRPVTAKPPRISTFTYNEPSFEEQEYKRIDECWNLLERKAVTWINVDGLGDRDLMGELQEHFHIHPLTLEDILSTGQRPKAEDYDDYLFLVFRMFSYDNRNHGILSEQVSLIIGKNFVISLQETEGDVFDPIRDRLRQAKGRLRKMGPDYLAYALLDCIVDNYFNVLNALGDRVEEIEDALERELPPDFASRLQHLKREMMFLRRQIWPLREMISQLQRMENKLLSKTTQVYLRDVYDHTVQVIDTIESMRDILGGLHDIYLSLVSNRMNEIMKVLTIIATIFIPLTFLAGIYGMNFQHMPELHWPWAYPALLGLMGLVAGGMVLYFRRKGWL